MEGERLIYSHDTLEFVTVAVEFCSQMEKAGGQQKGQLVDVLLKVAPLLYVKALLLPEVENDGEALPDPQVTEGDYDWVLANVRGVIGEDDDVYLDAYQGEEQRTEETRWRSLAEHLADVYQPVRNFLAVYQVGIEEQMTAALWEVARSFREYWGQALVDALRRMHYLMFCEREDESENRYDEGVGEPV